MGGGTVKACWNQDETWKKEGTNPKEKNRMDWGQKNKGKKANSKKLDEPGWNGFAPAVERKS